MIRTWLALVALATAAAAGTVARPACPLPSGPVQLPRVSESGYLQIDAQGSKLFFLFVEPSSSDSSAPVPITLWLQVIFQATDMLFEQRGGPRPHMPATRVQLPPPPLPPRLAFAGRPRMLLTVWRIL